jgi:hypothetical protein
MLLLHTVLLNVCILRQNWFISSMIYYECICIFSKNLLDSRWSKSFNLRSELWCFNIFTRLGRVTIDGVWIGEWIYWPLVYTTRKYILQITDTHRPVSSVYYSLSTSRFLATASTEGDSSASRTQVLLSQSPVQNSCQLKTQLTGSQCGGHFTPPSWSSLHRLISNWKLNSLTHQPAASRHFTQLNCWQVQPKLTRCFKLSCL